MRTTVTLDPETHALLQRQMKERGISFKQAVNEAIKRGLTGGEKPARWTFPTYDMGKPKVDITKTGRVLAELDTEEYLRKFGRP